MKSKSNEKQWNMILPYKQGQSLMKSKSNEKLMSDDRKESDLWKDKSEMIVKVRM